MRDSPHDLPDEVAVLVAALLRWEDELRAMDKSRESLIKKIDTARPLLKLLTEGEIAPVQFVSQAEVKANEAAPPDETKVVRLPPRISPDASWAAAVRAWVYSAPLGLNYVQLRELMDTAPSFAEKFRQSEKGYYNAISRLKARKDIIKHNNMLFSPQAFKKFQQEVKSGVVEDVPPVVGAYSPMGEAILDIVGRFSKTGILGKDILNELRKDPEFNATLTPHNSGAYNVIARLAKRNQILRRDDGLCFPGVKFPSRDPQSKWLLGSLPTSGHDREQKLL